MLNTDVVQAAPAVNDSNDPRSATDRQQKYWTVGEVEHWMCFRGSRRRYQGPQIEPSDRVSWRHTDGDIIDMSVGGYVRDRDKWAFRPLEYWGS
jgi:hypothetical protein